jgi:hypothetical protein
MYRITRCYIQEDGNLDAQCRDKFRFLSDALMITRLTHRIFRNFWVSLWTCSDESTCQWRILERILIAFILTEENTIFSFKNQFSFDQHFKHTPMRVLQELSYSQPESLKNSLYCLFHLKRVKQWTQLFRGSIRYPTCFVPHSEQTAPWWTTWLKRTIEGPTYFVTVATRLLLY